MLNRFLETGKLDYKLSKTGNYEYNISQLNSTRKKITKKYANSGIKVNFRYQNESESYMIKKGTRMFGTKNVPKKVVNNCLYMCRVLAIMK